MLDSGRDPTSKNAIFLTHSLFKLKVPRCSAPTAHQVLIFAHHDAQLVTEENGQISWQWKRRARHETINLNEGIAEAEKTILLRGAEEEREALVVASVGASIVFDVFARPHRWQTSKKLFLEVTGGACQALFSFKLSNKV